jgi:mannitol-1-phosphate/altronate dehydrogenase
MAEGDQRWGIDGVSLRSKAVADVLIPQDLLYCVLEREGERFGARLVGALNQYAARSMRRRSSRRCSMRLPIERPRS